MTNRLAVVTLALVLGAGGAPLGFQARPRPVTQKPPAQVPPPARVPANKPASPAPPPPPATDVRLVTAYTHGPQVSQNVTYLRGERQRVEFPGIVSINQCDLKRTVLLNTTEKRYRVQPHTAPATASAPNAAEVPDLSGAMSEAGMPGRPSSSKRRGGVITVTTTMADTLERQTMFGLEARRVKTTMVRQPGDKACDSSTLKVEVDAWYVDLPAPSMCAVPTAPSAPAPAAEGTNEDTCTDRLETRVAGEVTLGFPLKSVTTTTSGAGDKAEVLTVSQEVTALEVMRLDPALFDVPAGFTEARSSAEIVPSLASGGSLADALFGSTADGTSEAAPKQPGMIRVGILEPVNRSERTLSTSALRQELASRFNKAPYEAIPVAGSSPTAIEADAVRLECDYLLLTEITGVKSSRPGRLGGAMRRVSGEAARDRHDVTLDYTLFAVGATGAPGISGKAKGSSGGFGVGSALKLAAFAGQMYMSMYGMSGMGMMNMTSMSASGGGPMGGLYDPRASAMNSMAMGLDGGMGDPSEVEMRETVSEALANAAKAVTEQLKKK